MVAAIFEARLTREQARRLASLMKENRATRPRGVLTTILVLEGEIARLIAVWKNRDTLDRYLSVVTVPRGAELMRQVGAEPAVRIAEVLDCG
jgi:hypothetical protein